MMLPKVQSTMLKLRPFNPSVAFGEAWSLEKESRDSRWDSFSRIDLMGLTGTDCWRGDEKYHTGEERQHRLISSYADSIRVGPSLAIALREEPQKFPEEWKHLVLFCDQLVVRDSMGRYAVSVHWANSRVFVRCRSLHIGRLQGDFSLLLKEAK